MRREEIGKSEEKEGGTLWVNEGGGKVVFLAEGKEEEDGERESRREPGRKKKAGDARRRRANGHLSREQLVGKSEGVRGRGERAN